MKEVLKAAATATAFTFLLLALASLNINAQAVKNRPAAASDVKIRQKMTSGGSSTETAMFVKGPRMRNEMNSVATSMITIRQCDLKRTLMINDKTKTYMIIAEGNSDGAAQVPTSAGEPARPTRRGGVVNLTSTLNDTGERKQMFGFTARHIKSSTVKEASADACSPGNSKIETDGWYIDFQFDFDCPGQAKKVTPGVPSRPDCEDEVRTRSIGSAKLGFPVWSTTTIYGPDGTAESTMTNEVLELSREPLDPALFDVPQGYRLVTSYQELYGMASEPTRPTVDNRDEKAPGGGNPVMAAAANAPAGFVAANSPKKPGVIRIGIMPPKAQMTGDNGSQAAEALRNTFASFLNGPSVELVALSSRLGAQAIEEAKQAQCDFVLSSSLTQKKGGGGMFGKALGNIATSAVGHVPGASTAGGAAARSVAISGVYTAADVSRSVKSKDELSLEYRLDSIDGTKPGFSKVEKAKAKSDGEDIFTPLVEKAAEAVFSAIK
jgi:hypothetical protein